MLFLSGSVDEVRIVRFSEEFQFLTNRNYIRVITIDICSDVEQILPKAKA